jgi:hypothetical protein
MDLELDNKDVEQPIQEAEEDNKPEKFVDFVLGVFSTNSNPIIKGIRTDIENCFKGLSGFLDKDKQKQTLRDMMINIIKGIPLNDEEVRVMNSKYVIKKFLHPKEEIFFKYILLDLIYECYDFYRDDLVDCTEYIDEISNYINNEKE